MPDGIESCEVCGFVWADVAPGAVEPRLRAAVTNHRSLLRRPPAALRRRPAEGVWSAMEVAAHVRDVLLVLRERTILALVEEHPDPPPMYRDERVDRRLYAAETPAALAAELEAATDLYCRVLAGLGEAELTRSLVYGMPPIDRTIAWMGAQAVHETEHHLDDARAALVATGAAAVADPDRALLMEVVIDCADPALLSVFWQEVVAGVREVRGDDWATVRDPRPGGVLLAFQKVPEPKIAKNRVHLDLWSTDIDADVARAVAAGAVPVGPLIVEAQGPFQVMADPEGNEFCFVG